MCVVPYHDVCCLKSGEFESSRNPEHPLSLHMLKSRGSLAPWSWLEHAWHAAWQRVGGQEFPGPPQRPQVVPNRISHPLHAGGSERALPGWFCHCLLVSQCVSVCQMLARKPNLTPAAKPICGLPQLQLSLQVPSARLVKLSARLVLWSAVANHSLPGPALPRYIVCIPTQVSPDNSLARRCISY